VPKYQFSLLTEDVRKDPLGQQLLGENILCWYTGFECSYDPKICQDIRKLKRRQEQLDF